MMFSDKFNKFRIIFLGFLKSSFGLKVTCVGAKTVTNLVKLQKSMKIIFKFL